MNKTLLVPRPMTLDEFLPLVGLTLEMDCNPRSVTATLVEASPLRPNGLGGRPPFILIFRTNSDTFLVAGTYGMRRGTFGPAAIDIAPVARPAGGVPGHYYQAVFN